MWIIKNTIFSTQCIQKEKNLIFDVSTNTKKDNVISFVINAKETFLLIEMDRIMYRSLKFVYIDGEKTFVDFYSNINISINESNNNKLLSGIIIPDFKLDKWK